MGTRWISTRSNGSTLRSSDREHAGDRRRSSPAKLPLLVHCLRLAEFRQALQLAFLRTGDLLKVLDQDTIQLLMQGHNLDFGLEIDLIIEASRNAVPSRLSILRHQNDWSLRGGNHREDQIEKDVRVRIERLMGPRQNDSVENNP